MKIGKRASRKSFLGTLFQSRERTTQRRAEVRRLRRFEFLESRWMMHGDHLHDDHSHDDSSQDTAEVFSMASGEGISGVNGPHAGNPTYDLNSFHIHAGLSIYVNGSKVPIPTFGGVSGGDSIHTHDGTGQIHIHPTSPRSTYVKLGEVFDAWKAAPQNGNANAILTDSNLLNNVEDATHKIYMFVNGVRVSSYQDYQIHDGDDVVLAYSDNPIITVNTNLGSIPVELFADKTPITVNNFLNYVNDGDYNNSFFHRYVSNFVLQGGGFKSSTSSFTDPSVANNFTAVSTDAQIQNEFDNYAKRTGTGSSLTAGNAVISLGSNVDLSNVAIGDRIRINGRTDGIGGTNMFDITAVNDAANTVTVQQTPTGSGGSNLTWTIFPKVNTLGTLSMAKLGGNPNSATSQFFINLVNNDANLDLQNGGFTVFGQILDQSILTDIAALNDLSLFNANLTGSQEVPAVSTSATGSATLALNNKNNQFDLKLNVQGLSAANITGSHIHTGGTGVEGASFFDLGAGTQYTANGTQLQRVIDNAAFPTAQINSLFSSQTYLNVHTSANPDGEIRGQLTSLQNGLYSDLPTTSTDQLVMIQSISGEGTVKGTIYTDTDGDGVKDAGETGRQGMTVFSDANNNGTLDSGEVSATTDSNGAYALTVASGVHKIRLVPTTGFAKTQPADAYDVTVQIGREVTGRDFGVVQVQGLTGVDLLPATDSGASSTDNITNFNNSTLARALQFSVTGAVPGGLIRILADGVVIGQTTVPAGNNGTITVTTNGSTTLTNGARSIVATQEFSGVQSPATTPLTVTIDALGPEITSTAPTAANVGTEFTYNVESSDESQAGFVYALLNAPTGATINATTGVIAWTPTANQVGTNQFQVSATDAAGNVSTQPLAVVVSKTARVKFNLITTDLNGNPITTINVGETFQLRATVEDLRPSASRTGVFSAYQDVAFDGDLATANTITHSTVYGQGAAGTISDGLIDEVGSFAPSIQPLGPNPQLLYTITLTADRSGVLSFEGNAPDVTPQHDIGVYGINDSIPLDEVNYGLASITVVNPNFQANNDVFNFDEGTTNNPLNVLANDQGRPNATLTILSTGTTNKGGTVAIAGNGTSLVYTPQTNFFGEETFTYIVSDGSDQAVATVTVQVVDVNDPPPAIGEHFTGSEAVMEDSVGNVLDLLKNERTAANPDQGAPNEILRISAVGTTSNGGTVTIGAQGAFVTYTPAPNFSGTETFTYTVTDRSGGTGLSATATATVTVTAQNDNPLAVNDAVTADEDSQNNIFSVLTNDSTEEGETLTISSVSAGNRGGQVTIVENGTKVSYTPAANVFGTETFTYTVSDGNGGSATATVTVTLASKNDAPDAVNDTVNVGKNSTNNILDVLLNDLATPDENETFVITTVTQGNQGGVVEIVENGAKIRYRPANNYLGSETFTYTMRDPGGLTDTATVTITVRDFLPSSLAGFVYLDSDNDGVKDTGEQAVPNVKITLTGTDNFGTAVTREANTDSTGAYKFENLAPGNYKVKQTQPAGPIGNLPVVDGKDTIGSQGGTVSANDEFTITLAENVNGTGNNFGELTGFRIEGKVMNESGGNTAHLAFNGVEVQLFNVDAQNKPTGSALKTATIGADGSFTFDGISAGKYAIQSESLAFLNAGTNQHVVEVTNGNSLSNVLVQGVRQARYVSYRDFMNSTPRTGIFAAVSPGNGGQQWSALDTNWAGYSAAKVELSADASKVRIDVTKTTGEQLFDEIPVSDPRVAILATEGNARLLRLAGVSTSYNLRPVTTSSGSGEGEGVSHSSDIGGEGEGFTTFVQPAEALLNSNSFSDSLTTSSLVVPEWTSPAHDSNLLPDTDVTSDQADLGVNAPAIDAILAEEESFDPSEDTDPVSSHDDANLFEAIDSVMAEEDALASA